MYYDENISVLSLHMPIQCCIRGKETQEEEFELDLVKSYYPRIVQEIQERVEEMPPVGL